MMARSAVGRNLTPSIQGRCNSERDMANERITESIIRSHFETYKDEIVLEEQKSANSRVDNLLRKASKRGTGARGYPEFIIRANQESGLLGRK